jgi:large subunit ribosomal protein L24
MAGLKIKKGDRVIVLQGKNRGDEGVVTRVLPSAGKVVVEGVNKAKKHQKARSATQQGGIIEIEMPLPVSNVALLSPKDGKATKVGYRFNDRGEKVRICRRTKVEL